MNKVKAFRKSLEGVVSPIPAMRKMCPCHQGLAAFQKIKILELKILDISVSIAFTNYLFI